jgi:anti-anti-sigma factor
MRHDGSSGAGGPAGRAACDQVGLDLRDGASRFTRRQAQARIAGIMAITIRRRPGERRTVVVISGAVDAWAVPSLRRALVKALRSGDPILVDLTQATSIHRAGLAALVAAYRRADWAGTSMLLSAEPAQIRTILAAYGIPAEESPPDA